jgi:hypothetical protein
VNARVDVICHELGHALVRLDRRDEDPPLGYAEEDLVAESVAHLALSFVGLDSSASAVPYLASWAKSAALDTFELIAALVDRLARRLEDALSDTKLVRGRRVGPGRRWRHGHLREDLRARSAPRPRSIRCACSSAGLRRRDAGTVIRFTRSGSGQAPSAYCQH